MVTIYKELVSKEFVEICVINDGIHRVELQRAIDRGKKTIDILASQGISTKGIPIVEQETKDYFDKPREVNYSGLSENPQSALETGNPRISFDHELYQHEKDELGRAIFPILKKKFIKLCNDSRMQKLMEN